MPLAGTPERIHRMNDQNTTHERTDAHDRLAETLNDQQRALLLELTAATEAHWAAEQQAVISEITRHLGTLETVVRLVHGHVLNQSLDQRGLCCADGAEERSV
jgi:DNA-binding transcriptional regulator YbjK